MDLFKFKDPISFSYKYFYCYETFLVCCLMYSATIKYDFANLDTFIFKGNYDIIKD